MKIVTCILCAITLLFSAAAIAQAQVITSGEIERGLRSGNIADGYVPFSHRYFYGTGPYIYVNGDANRLRYMDYLDRADRAAKFGYAMPADPFESPPPMPQAYPAGRVYVGGGFGIWRRR